jgi:dihydrofolate reductase
MTRIVADISVSLDGFVTGPDPGPDNGMAPAATPCWAFSEDPDERQIAREATARSGAVVLGRRLFDVVDGPNGWDDNVGYGAREVGKPAFVVVTSSPPESVRLTDLDWTFVHHRSARCRRRGARPCRGGVVGQRQGPRCRPHGRRRHGPLGARRRLVDALTLHLAPVVLGAETPLFTGGAPRTLVQRRVISTPNVTHLTYDVL